MLKAPHLLFLGPTFLGIICSKNKLDGYRPEVCQLLDLNLKLIFSELRTFIGFYVEVDYIFKILQLLGI